MADTSFYGRLKKLFSTAVIVRNQGGKLKVIDYDETQAIATNLRDRYMRLHSSAMNNTFENYLAYQQIRQELFRDYDSMDQDPIITSALDIYADESTSRNEYGRIVEIKTNNDHIKDILTNLFYDVVNVEFNLWPWVRNMVKYGDFFLHLEIAENLGIVGVQPLSAYEITRVEGFDPNNWQAVKFVHTPLATKSLFVAGQKTEYENYEIAHFRLLSDTNFLPYGKSILEGARRLWKQLSLMEDAMIIHRIVRAPQKRIFKIDVGGIAPNEVDQYIQRIINKSKKTPYVNADTGEYNLKYNVQNLMEDFYLPVRGNDSGTEITNLDGLEYAPMEDIDYLKNKMFAALKIPKQHLGYLEDGNSKATLAAMDMRFAKTIERLQRIVVDGLEKIAIAHLYSQGIDDSELTNFELELTLPSLIYEQEKVNLWTMKMELIQKMDQLKVISKEWMYKNILNFSYEEAALQVEGLKKDAMLTFKLTNLETTGNEKPQEQQSALGQQPPLGSDENGEPMDTDEPPIEGDEQPQEEPTPNGQPLNVEDQIQKLKSQLGGEEEDEEQPQQEAKAVGRPKEYSTRGKDKSPFGRDVTGSKDLKNQYKNESFIDMLRKNIIRGGSKIINEGKSMLDEQNIIEN
jgi:hypothetical protein